MKTTYLRTLLALTALLSLSSFAPAEEVGFGNILGQWSGAQMNNQAGYNARQVGYMPESGGGQPSNYYNGANYAAYNQGNGNWQNCSYDGCANGNCGCNGCDGSYCGDGGCYQGGCSDGGYCEGGCCEGGYCPEGCPCDGACGCGPTNYCDFDACGGGTMCYVEIQNLFLRAHVSDQVVGKLREKHEWSPRAVVGVEGANGLGARGRYWNYNRTTDTVDGTDELGFDMNVIDVEGTARLRSKRADLVLAGGFRWADIQIEDESDEVDAGLPGITFAADGRVLICCGQHSQWAGVAGARWSLLGGDWEGDNALVEETFDDNVNVQEIYGGVEYVCHHGNCSLFTRAVFEIQNWHSDAMGESSATDSISFVGPALHGGIAY